MAYGKDPRLCRASGSRPRCDQVLRVFLEPVRGQADGGHASARRIAQAVEEWDDAGTLGAELYDGEVAYFRERYFRDGEFTSLFYGLRIRKGDMPALIPAGISGDAEAPRERVLTVLLLIWRLRNNLFHGEKWAYGLQGQLANFTHANVVLMRVLERHADLH